MALVGHALDNGSGHVVAFPLRSPHPGWPGLENVRGTQDKMGRLGCRNGCRQVARRWRPVAAGSLPGAVQVSGLLTFREHRAGLNKRTRYVLRSGMWNGRRVRLSAKCAEIGARIHRTCQWHMSNILLVTCLPCRQHFDGRVCAGRAREWQAYCMQFGLIMRLSTHYQRFLQECILLLTVLCCRTIKVIVARYT